MGGNWECGSGCAAVGNVGVSDGGCDVTALNAEMMVGAATDV